MKLSYKDTGRLLCIRKQSMGQFKKNFEMHEQESQTWTHHSFLPCEMAAKEKKLQAVLQQDQGDR